MKKKSNLPPTKMPLSPSVKKVLARLTKIQQRHSGQHMVAAAVEKREASHAERSVLERRAKTGGVVLQRPLSRNNKKRRIGFFKRSK